jgi:hypothetical protein
VARGRRCVYKRRLTVRLVSTLPLLRARLRIPHRRLKKLRERAVKRSVRLRRLRLRKGRVTIRASARAKDKRLLRTRRTFRACRGSKRRHRG